MVESNLSARPLLDATLRSLTSETIFCAKVSPAHSWWYSCGAQTRTEVDRRAVGRRNWRLTSTMVLPRQVMRRAGLLGDLGDNRGASSSPRA